MRLLYFLSLCSLLISNYAASSSIGPTRLARAVTFSNRTGNLIKVIWYSYQFGREERNLPNGSQLTAYDVDCQDREVHCAYCQIAEDRGWGDDISLPLDSTNAPQTIVIP